jgi:hypothetical protein
MEAATLREMRTFHNFAGSTAGSPVMMKSLGMVLVGAAAIAFLVPRSNVSDTGFGEA